MVIIWAHCVWYILFQVLPCVQNEDPFVRDLAFNCLGLAAILDVSLAQKYLLLFLQVLSVGCDACVGFY